jgi:methyltransferase OMS1, mitochondrial
MNCRGLYNQQSQLIANKSVQNAHTLVCFNRRLSLLSTCIPIVQNIVSPSQSQAANPTAQDIIRTDYDSFAATYDDLDSGPLAQAFGFPDLRAALISQASGNVCEVGVGTGLNLPYYVINKKINHLTTLDISSGMLNQAQKRTTTLITTNLSIDFIQDDITNLQNPSSTDLLSTFNTIVDTFSLCVYPDPLKALSNMRSLLDPNNGRLLLLEHSKSSNSLLGAYQDVTSNIVAKNGKGCVWNQDVVGLLKAAGFEIVEKQSHLGGIIISVVAKPAG